VPLALLHLARASIVVVFLWVSLAGDEPRALASGDDREILGRPGLVVGPSIGWGRAGAGNQILLGVDVTLHESILWQSVGVKVAVDDPRFLMPYLEIGVWFLANWGVGYSTTIADGKSSDYFNLFLGIPLPSRDWNVPRLFTKTAPSFLEPYYRPAFRFGGDAAPIIHEVGLLVKVMYDFGQ
jgi:hypothetical protein